MKTIATAAALLAATSIAYADPSPEELSRVAAGMNKAFTAYNRECEKSRDACVLIPYVLRDEMNGMKMFQGLAVLHKHGYLVFVPNP